MAYDSSKEIREEVKSVSLSHEGDSIKIASIQYGDKKSIDVRQWYTSTLPDGTKQELPTKRGVRLSDEDVADVVCGIIMAMSDEQRYDLMASLEENEIILHD